MTREVGNTNLAVVGVWSLIRIY